MKRITFTVPCYNSQDYMERCLDSLLQGGDQVEIIVVDDGSTDRTGEIADRYEKKYPGIVRAVHQENGGHGAGVQAGLALAEGKYFKVVDSDDWVDGEALRKVLQKMESWEKEGQSVDLIVCNYVYDHLFEGKTKKMGFQGVFKENEICGWNEIGHFKPSQYLVMHALIFRKKVLERSGLVLPRHTFYVDNIFANQPLPYVEKLYYLDLNLYHYFLGRDGQSVNEKVLMSRIDQHIKVTKMVADCVDLEQVWSRYPRLAEYLTRNISIMMTISIIHLLKIGTPEAFEKRDELWNYIKQRDAKLYRRLRLRTLSGLTCLPGKAGAGVTLAGYRAAQKIYQFN